VDRFPCLQGLYEEGRGQGCRLPTSTNTRHEHKESKRTDPQDLRGTFKVQRLEQRNNHGHEDEKGGQQRVEVMTGVDCDRWPGYVSQS
jgi:hypothetical protein